MTNFGLKLPGQGEDLEFVAWAVNIGEANREVMVGQKVGKQKTKRHPELGFQVTKRDKIRGGAVIIGNQENCDNVDEMGRKCDEKIE